MKHCQVNHRITITINNMGFMSLHVVVYFPSPVLEGANDTVSTG
jgi:hypothetical protein